jgi:hypothetical protein
MTTALGTLPFLATLWLLAVLGASLLEESGAKIAAALKGKPVSQAPAASVKVRVRMRQSPTRREVPRWRAAA